jgi:hypothetical protein
MFYMDSFDSWSISKEPTGMPPAFSRTERIDLKNSTKIVALGFGELN